jgi:hypothetical protein
VTDIIADITATALPAINSIVQDGFEMLAKAAPARVLRGDLIKFRKGAYPVGRDEGDMLGSTLAAYDGTMTWSKWHEQRLVAQIAVGDVDPFPEEVSDIVDDGSPGEWSLAYLLFLQDLETGYSYTFSTATNGGRRAVTSLSSAIRNKRRIVPGAVPLIRLDAGGFKTQSYGMVPCPQFTIVGWVDNGGKTLSAAPLSVELNDSIPFISSAVEHEPCLFRKARPVC